jgi:peptidoglycan/LPS O-acetylase OafA/YrhL
MLGQNAYRPAWRKLLLILAALRFFFAFCVLCDHTYIFGPASRAMPVLSLSGLMPVTCFLSISGFSIHHSISSQPVGYFARRFWRIVPTNIVAVAIAFFAYQYFGFLTDGVGHQVPCSPQQFYSTSSIDRSAKERDQPP